MDENTIIPLNRPPQGTVEPHAGLLSIPSDDQLLYKIMTVENLLSSIRGGYLHFNRVDGYPDLPGFDGSDGEQLTQDRQKNAAQSFANAPDWSLADYYDQSRARTYACCFALQDSPFLWNNYGNHNKRGKVCLVFNFGKLRAILNKALSSSNARIDYGGVLCQQIFNLNYGSVKYIDRRTFQANITRYPNPFEYTFLKDESFSSESELRVSLSAVGVGRFVLDNGSEFQFPRSIQAPFHFQAAGDGTIDSILFEPGFDKGPLSADLKGLGIEI